MWREYDVLHIADTGSTILSFHLYELHRLLLDLVERGRSKSYLVESDGFQVDAPDS